MQMPSISSLQNFLRIFFPHKNLMICKRYDARTISLKAFICSRYILTHKYSRSELNSSAEYVITHGGFVVHRVPVVSKQHKNCILIHHWGEKKLFTSFAPRQPSRFESKRRLNWQPKSCSRWLSNGHWFRNYAQHSSRNMRVRLTHWK